uniref:Uncharacterized protein n=1 Tax=Rhizophora mucronata TaxID=61149 RepID=A0A2P2MJS8_RHIMU
MFDVRKDTLSLSHPSVNFLSLTCVRRNRAYTQTIY